MGTTNPLPPPPVALQAPISHRLRTVFIVIGLLAAIVIGNAALHTTSTPGSGPGIKPGLGTNDASGDIDGVGWCSSSPMGLGDSFLRPQPVGGQGGYGRRLVLFDCRLTLTNHSAGVSNYVVTATITDTSGAYVGYATAVVENVGAGQTRQADLTGSYTGSDTNVSVHIVQVQRGSKKPLLFTPL